MQVKPISLEEFAKIMDFFSPWEENPLFAVAVSGGADSIALCRLSAEYAKKINGKIVALTVDHGLRKESFDEAVQVNKWLKKLNIEHHILSWQGEKPTSRIEEIARNARYDLLFNWCKTNGCLHLLLAHNQGDQAETFLLRLAKSSGVDGLAAMPAQSFRRDVEILRPLLSFNRERIIATNKALNQEWIEDPSNQSEVFQRVKWRHFFPSLKHLGITNQTIEKAICKQAEIKSVLDNIIAELSSEVLKISNLGFAEISWAKLENVQKEIICRLLTRVIMVVGGNIYPPKKEQVAYIYENLKKGYQKAGQTLAGCKIILRKNDAQLLVVREKNKLPKPLFLPKQTDYSLFWDRFNISFDGELPQDAFIAPLGCGKKSFFPQIYPQVLVSLPAIFLKDSLLLVPHLGYKDKNLKIGNIRVSFLPPLPLTGANIIK